MISHDRTTPLISVIVPVHNAESYLERCFNSILSQTISNIELILVDDGSDDCSPRICDRYADTDKRVKVVHKTNEGVSKARNTGLEIARGEYVAFVDADDYIAPDMYEELVRRAQKVDADEVCSGCVNVFKDRESIALHAFKNTVLYPDQIYENLIIPLLTPGESDKKAKLLQNVWNKLYKKKIIDKYNIRFDATFDYAEDWLFNIGFYRFASIVAFIDYSPYYYDRTVKGSLSKKKCAANFEDSIRLRKIEKEWFPLFCTDEIYRGLVEKIWKHHVRLYAIQVGFTGFEKYINDIWQSACLIEASEMETKRCSFLFWMIKRKRRFPYCLFAFYISTISFIKHYVKRILKNCRPRFYYNLNWRKPFSV